MKQKSFVVVAALLVLLFASSMTARHAYACTCGGEITQAEATGNADVVFTGKVTHVTRAFRVYGNPDHTYELDVQSVSKGQVGPRVTFKLKSSCSYGFRQGGTYLVYATYSGGNPDDLDASACSGTKLIDLDFSLEATLEAIPPGLLLMLGTAAGTLGLGLGIGLYEWRRHKKAQMLD